MPRSLSGSDAVLTDMTNRTFALVILLASGLSSAACLVKDTTHRLYLAPVGTLEWSVLERDVRSQDGSAPERWREEQLFLDGVSSGSHPIVEGLRRLEPEEASVRLLRAERPFAAISTARYQRADAAIRKLFDELRIPGSASLAFRADEATLTVSIDLSRIDEHGEDLDTPVTALVENLIENNVELNRYRVVLTEGRFVSAEGFEIVDDGTAAELKPERVPVDRPATLRLTWKVR
jgi:hypothetical protein